MNHYVCFDFSKTFDTVKHKLLTRNLQISGIRGQFLSIFKQCFTKNKWFGSVKNCFHVELYFGHLLSFIFNFLVKRHHSVGFHQLECVSSADCMIVLYVSHRVRKLKSKLKIF